MQSTSTSLLTLALALISTPVLATEEQAQGPHGDPHAEDRGIVVVGHPPLNFNLLNSTSTIEGDKLEVSLRGQLGETLSSLPGVSATSFTPGASRPVLRGFDGDRIRVLTDGIGAIDASSVSADHAVVFDALTVDHIDVLHGPAVLLFGGQAIGGAVNALDKRIPRSVPDGIKFDALGSYGSAANERAVAAGDRHRAGEGLHHQVVAGFVAERTLGAIARDRAADQPRMPLAQFGDRKAQLADGAGLEILHEHVGLRRMLGTVADAPPLQFGQLIGDDVVEVGLGWRGQMQ